jgi:hypothetical protein
LEQAGSWQTPAEHVLNWQSLFALQPSPLGHFCGGAQGPPQSLPVSCPFLTPSAQPAAWHLPPWQTLLVQSLAALQAKLSAQGLQEPPQSLSVSEPLTI